MITETLTLKADSPLALHRRRASEQFAPTLDYLPGSSVRGALADLYLGGDPQRAKDEIFKALFISESDGVRFSDFLPVPAGWKGPAHVLPATATACKRFGDHEAASMTDGLLRLELAREMEDAAPLELGGWDKCPECQKAGRASEKRDRAEAGYYTQTHPFERIRIDKRMITGTAIERATGTAAHGALFSHEVVELSAGAEGDEGQGKPGVKPAVAFRGVVQLPDELRSPLHDLVPYRQRLAIGYGRSRGLGHLLVDGWSAPPAERRTLPERWKALNAAAAELWAQFGRKPAGQYFTLTLQSQLALENEAGEPVLGDVTAADFGLPPEAERRRSVLSAVLVSGWNAAWGLPKADTWAIGRGSVLLFCLPPGAALAPTLERLAALEADGLGLRRAEGFGRMTACDPFHFDFLQRELKGGS